MSQFLPYFVALMLIFPVYTRAAPIGYSITITTAYAHGDPFPNRIDDNFTEPNTGYFAVDNTGSTTFAGIVGTVAVSSFAGDLSFASGAVVLAPGETVSIAIPDNSEDVGGFNGPYYFYRPGVEITLNGTISNGALTEAVALLVADRDMHSGDPRTDVFGLTSDSFVLQGGDLWGFQNPDPFALSQAYGVYTFSQPVPEPGSGTILAAGMTVAAVRFSGFRRRNRHRQ
jgi:hypothetical protein